MSNGTAEFSIVALSNDAIRMSAFNSMATNEEHVMLTVLERPLRFEMGFWTGERLTVTLVGSGREPTSLWTVLDSLKEIADLPVGWDSYGARPLSAAAVRRSFNLLPVLLPDDGPAPTVVPRSDGGVQFEWHARGFDLEVAVPAGGPITFYVADASLGEELELGGAEGRDKMRSALARMAGTA